MTTLSGALKRLYPHLDPATDYVVTDNLDGAGQVLACWDESRLGPRPSGEQIADAMALADSAAPMAAKSPLAVLAARMGMSVADTASAIREAVGTTKL